MLTHDWLCGYRGGEAVLDAIARVIERRHRPAALLAMFDDGRPMTPTIDAWRRRGLLHASAVNRIPGAAGRLRRWLLPLYPRAVSNLSGRLRALHDADPIDLLVSTSSAAIKGLRPPPGVPHLCYCHSPARYVWARQADYGVAARGVDAAGSATAGPKVSAPRDLAGRVRSIGLSVYASRFREWDRATAANVTRFLANSSHIAEQIARCYGAPAGVVFPPVQTGYFTPDPSVPREPFWLVVSALEPYKRVDTAIAAAAMADRTTGGGRGHPLVIAGDGSQRRVLEQAAGPNVRFLGRVAREELRRLYRTASVLLFPQIEDFGIAAAEAQACGLPVVARRAGGALDIVVDGRTGVLYDGDSAESLLAAIARTPQGCAGACRKNAERFGEGVFLAAIEREIDAAVRGRCEGYGGEN